MSNVDRYSDDEVTKGGSKIPGAPGAVVVAEDPTAPSKDVSSKQQSLSDLFTIVSPSNAQMWLAVCFFERWIADAVGAVRSSALASLSSAMDIKTI